MAPTDASGMSSIVYPVPTDVSGMSSIAYPVPTDVSGMSYIVYPVPTAVSGMSSIVYPVWLLHSYSVCANGFITALSQLTGAPEVLIASVQTFWRTLQTTCRRVPFSVTSDGLYNKVTFNLTAMGNQFPFPPATSPGPEVADIILMLMTYADVMLPGRMLVSDLSSIQK